jgi:polyhydroxybutyrate depolymerase
VRTAALRWTATAVIAVAAGLVAGYMTGRPLPQPVARTVHASSSRSSRLGRTAPPATPEPTPSAPPAPATGTTTTTVTLDVSGLSREYQVIRPVQPVAPRIPALVVLHGVNASVDYEEQRDGLVPVAAEGQAILVYPAGYQESWNAGVCCDPAMSAGVDDVGFLEQVIQQISGDPGVDSARISLVGFSNGGRMAYQVDCADPGLVTTVIAILAVPVTPCSTSTPVSLLAIAAADDPEVPYGSGTGAVEGLTAITDVVSAWRGRDGCTDTTTANSTAGQLVTAAWGDCRWGTQVELATYSTGGHVWQWGDGTTPSMGRLIWSFSVASQGLTDPLSQ